MLRKNSFVSGLRCRECGKKFDIEPSNICDICFGPLEVEYDYEKINLKKSTIKSRPKNMWRYRELLPVSQPIVGFDVGFTPLQRARNLEKYFGMKEIWIKNDGVNHPSLSFKDRVVAIAITKAKDFGFSAVACASTGNLANSVASLSAAAGMKAFIFIPHDLEKTKIIGTSIYGAEVIGIKGTYDEVNRLCTQISEKYNIAFVNINIRPFYSEGSKTFGMEILEQLGFRAPDAIVVPMAGGSLVIKIWKAIKEFEMLGLIKKAKTRLFGAQPMGCSPIVNAVKENLEIFVPVKNPKTIVKSLAIGNPPDGYYAIKAIRESGGWAENPTDEEVIAGMKLLAEKEGIFTETAGGTTVAAFVRLIETGKISKEECVVLSITGNGLKTQESLYEHISPPKIIEPTLQNFEENFKDKIYGYLKNG